MRQTRAVLQPADDPPSTYQGKILRIGSRRLLWEGGRPSGDSFTQVENVSNAHQAQHRHTPRVDERAGGGVGGG